MANYTSQELQGRLPPLPSPLKKTLPAAIIAGLSVGTGQNRFALIDLRFRSLQDQSFVPDPRVDLRMTNASRRKMFTLDASKQAFVASLNLALRGGESYPILSAVLGIATGFVSAGAGVLFSVGTTAMSAAQTAQPIQARPGDEIWQVELVGRDGTELKHVEYYAIVDPFRAKDPGIPSEWIIHEARRPLTLG